MKYLKAWIKRELKPVEIVESKSTDSYYYDVDGVKIRLSDHYGHYSTCDILVVASPDMKFNNHYIVQDTSHPQLIVANNVAEAKTLVKTMVLLKRGEVGKQKMNERNREIVEKIVKKMNMGLAVTSDDLCEFGKHAHLVCPGYTQMSNHYRSLVRGLYRMGMPSETLRKMISSVVPEKSDETYSNVEITLISKKVSSINSDINRRMKASLKEVTIEEPKTDAEAESSEMPSCVLPANPVATQKYNDDLQIFRHMYTSKSAIKKMNLATACQFWSHLNTGFIKLFGDKWSNINKQQRKVIYKLFREYGLSLDDVIDFIKSQPKLEKKEDLERKVTHFAESKMAS